MRFTLEKSIISICIALSVVVLLLSVRGLAGVPTAEELGTPRWSFDGPLELSPERGRFALLYSLVEHHSLVFDVAVARLAVPDLAINGAGQYVSLFVPGVSFLVVPGYIVGKFFGAAQVGAFAVIALFGLANAFLIARIAWHLGAKRVPALLAGLTYLFATPGFAYATTLYQHQISVFVLLLALFCLVRPFRFWQAGIIWFLCAASVVIDNPNLFLMAPVGVVTLVRLWQSFQITLQRPLPWKKLAWGSATVLLFLPPMAFFLWYNAGAYGNPLQLPGTLKTVTEIDAEGQPVNESAYQKSVLTEEQLRSLEKNGTKEKSAVGFFETRNLYNGFYIHTLSPDRGVLAFTPVLLLGIAGLVLLSRRKEQMAALIIATIGANILLYSMWGDPWGGWAFGSRYLIPTYALLAIGLALALSAWGKKWWFLLLFLPLFAYSLGVNTLGAVTTNANPPKVQVLSLEAQTGHEQKYTFVRNWEFLHRQYETIGAKSFAYQEWFSHIMTAPQFFALLYGLLLVVGIALLTLGWFETENTRL